MIQASKNLIMRILASFFDRAVQKKAGHGVLEPCNEIDENRLFSGMGVRSSMP